MFKAAEILEESVTELCLAFAPADFEYNAITAWDNEWVQWATRPAIEMQTFSEHRTSWCEYRTEV
jgi:hypothetical protein